VVQELVEGFKNARPGVLQLARRAARSNEATENDGEDDSAEQRAPKKRRIEQDADQDGSGSSAGEGIRTRSQSRGVTRQAQAVPIETIDDIQDEEYIPGMLCCILTSIESAMLT
jgi:E3 ubiquitin-protein ligase RAD18